MANIRQKEFERSCIQVLEEIIGYARTEATKKHVSPYDVNIEEDDIQQHFTTYYSSSVSAYSRYLENLQARSLFTSGTEKETFRLRRDRPHKNEHFNLTNKDVYFPEDKPL